MAAKPGQPQYALGCIIFPVPLILVPLVSGPPDAVLAMLFGVEFLAVGGLLGGVIGVRETLFVVTIAASVGILWLIGSPIPRLRELPEAADLGSGSAPAEA